MRKSDLKKLIKPIVRECIQESLLEDGVLSKIISEVAIGLSPTETIVEQPKKKIAAPAVNRRESEALANLKEQRQKMLDAIGRDSMNGVNVFEGTDPIASAGDPGSTNSPQGALSGVDPRDPGVDITDLAGMFGDTWKVIKNG